MYKRWSINDWKLVVFSDESWFYVEDFRVRWVRRYEGQELSEDFSKKFKKQLTPKKVLMWAAIAYDGFRVMEFIDGTVNGANYKELL